MFASPVSVTVRNDSGQIIAGISVTAQDRRLDFPYLPPGGSARRWFRNTGRDGDYILSALRGDGTRIEAEDGYMTSGSFYGSAEFTVGTIGEVTFSESYN
jgi:hypothetical protein